jgi:WD40 repeat protein
MASTDQTVRVFISSTFRDMNAERDHLVTVVFPELRERVERLGLEFFDVDLRWGVPAKDANGETANSWEYCRQWIDRVEPFFVCILGQRYGWEPEPEQLKDPADRQRQQDHRRSITDLEVRHAVLNDGRKRRSYFYLRANDAPASASEFVDPPPLLQKLEQMKGEIRSCGRPVRPYPCRWTGEGFTEMDRFGQLVLGDLWSGVLRDRRFVSKEVWRQALGADPDADPVYSDESQPVPRELWEKIVELAKPAPKEPLDAECEQMDAFAAARLRWFQGRTKELEQLNGFLDATAADAPRLAVVAAVPGQGKSALLAKLHNQLAPSSRFVITHFVGATERSASAYALVERLLGEFDRSGIPWSKEQQEGQEPKRDFNSICLRLATRLGDYSGERRIVILVDALNQLSDGHELQWLPARLGPSVRVIVSCVEDAAPKADSAAKRILQALASRRSALLRVPLGPLTEEDVRTIVVAYLKEFCHELDREHLDRLCAIPQARTPLYLLAMLNELRTLGGNDLNQIVPALIASMPHDHPDTVSLFRWVLQRLEVFGAEEVKHWCLYLAHGRAGMSSRELADLLARKFGADAAATALLIERGLRRYLQRRGAQLDFFHGQLRQAVFELYGAQVEATMVHADIAAYYRDLADPDGTSRWKGDGPRPFLEVVFHLAGAEHLDELCETLCDLRFVEARCRYGQVLELIADYRLAQEHLPEAQEKLRQERERQARLARWTERITAYSHQWSERRDRVRHDASAKRWPWRWVSGGADRGRLAKGELANDSEPVLPDPPSVGRIWPEEEIEAECRRRSDHPTPLDRLRAFEEFVVSERHILLEFGQRMGLVVQNAFNHAPSGPVHSAAAEVMTDLHLPLLVRYWTGDAHTNPMPALMSIMQGSFVKSVSITPDGRRAVSGGGIGSSWKGMEKALLVWNLESGECLRALAGHTEMVESVSVTADGRRAVSGSRDKTVRVWDLESGQCLYVLAGHTGMVRSVSVTPDGRRAVSDADEGLRVWDLESGQCLRTLQGHTGGGSCVSVTPDGRRAVSGEGGELQVWDLETGACLRTLIESKWPVQSVSVTPDGRRAVSGNFDFRLRIWDLESGECPRTLEGHEGHVKEVSVTPDGRRAVSASEDRTVRVWDLESGQCLRTLQGHNREVTGVSVTADGLRAVSASEDSTVRVWNLETGLPGQVVPFAVTGVSCVSVTLDGKRAVSASDKVREWDLETGVCLRTLEKRTGYILSVTRDGLRGVSGGRTDNTVEVWDLVSGECLRTLKGQTSASVSPDGRWLISKSEDKTVRVWDLESGECLRTLAGQTGGIPEVGMTGVSVRPDGRCLISGSGDRTVRVWDLESGQCLRTLAGHTGVINSVSVTRDWRRAVSGSGDKTVRVWDLESGKCLKTLAGHTSEVTIVSVTPDGRRAVSLASGNLWSNDQTLLMWDLQTGTSVALFVADVSIRSVAISPSADLVVCGTNTGEVFFLKLH